MSHFISHRGLLLRLAGWPVEPLCRQPAVDSEHLPRDVTRCRHAQKDHRIGNLFRARQPTHGCPRVHLVQLGRVLCDGLSEHRCHRHPRRNGIHSNAPTRPFAGQYAGEVVDGRLAHPVGGTGSARLDPRRRRDVDDRAPVGQKVRESARQKVGRVDVGPKHGMVLFGRLFQDRLPNVDPHVVDQAVQTAGMIGRLVVSKGRPGGVHECGAPVFRGDIANHVSNNGCISSSMFAFAFEFQRGNIVIEITRRQGAKQHATGMVVQK
mmetsp:Transcript_10938/g.31755  ORF Transcript_10938/g.31755 Transcript_10938/m.31755 type:complete len:265 (-) Transcript_10938:224-1018(-)